mmetsp:Transcript_28491/g.95935  ORF Transcript_28491/g.95935 Transcript_28491/m.95935 type:complete len:239 (-) Transcript_28491:4938-5654(-)
MGLRRGRRLRADALRRRRPRGAAQGGGGVPFAAHCLSGVGLFPRRPFRAGPPRRSGNRGGEAHRHDRRRVFGHARARLLANRRGARVQGSQFSFRIRRIRARRRRQVRDAVAAERRRRGGDVRAIEGRRTCHWRRRQHPLPCNFRRRRPRPHALPRLARDPAGPSVRQTRAQSPRKGGAAGARPAGRGPGGRRAGQVRAVEGRRHYFFARRLWHAARRRRRVALRVFSPRVYAQAFDF